MRAALASMLLVGCVPAVTRAPPRVVTPEPGEPCRVDGPVVVDRTFAVRGFRASHAMEFVPTAAGLELVVVDSFDGWEQVGLGGPEVVRHRGVVLGGRVGLPDLALGERWMAVATVPRSVEEAEVVLADLHAPGQVHPISPGAAPHDWPKIVAAHDGGWALLWVRRGPLGERLRFVLVGADGRVRRVSDLEAETDPSYSDMPLVRTEEGYALLFQDSFGASSEPVRLVFRGLARDGTPTARSVLFADDRLGGFRMLPAPGGFVVAFAASGQLMFMRIDAAGQVVAPARAILRHPGLPELHHLRNLHLELFARHRGLYWAVASLRFCGVDVCGAPSRTLLVPIALDGRTGAPVEVATRGAAWFEMALGSLGDELLLAAYSGPFLRKLRTGRVRFTAFRCAGLDD